MDFLVYSRGAAAVAETEDADLNERHWSYMDGFADGMTARGPTLDDDRRSWTGSLHVVDLRDPRAVHEFVADEPYHQAGLFAEHVVWRFDNLLGRTMWQFADRPDEQRFLVLARTVEGQERPSPVPVADLAPDLGERLIVYGVLRDLEDDGLAGVALAVQAPTREALVALLGDQLAAYGNVGIHCWELGGRR